MILVSVMRFRGTISILYGRVHRPWIDYFDEQQEKREYQKERNNIWAILVTPSSIRNACASMTMTNRSGDGISLSFTCDYDSHFLPHVKLHDVSLFVPIWQFDEMYINPIPLGSVSFLLLSTLLTQIHTFEHVGTR